MRYRSSCFAFSFAVCLFGCASQSNENASGSSGGNAGSTATAPSSAGQASTAAASGASAATTATATGTTAPVGQASAGGHGGATLGATAAGSGNTATVTVLPDGSSCESAPSDALGAREAWQTFLTWQAKTAPGCGVTDTWSPYDCVARYLDPRRIADFTHCMMSDGCNTVSEEDGCYINPPVIPAKGLPGNPYLGWLDGVCTPKATECSFSDDYCVLVARTVYRPELRCGLRDCVEKPCNEVEACIKNVVATFTACN